MKTYVSDNAKVTLSRKAYMISLVILLPLILLTRESGPVQGMVNYTSSIHFFAIMIGLGLTLMRLEDTGMSKLMMALLLFFPIGTIGLPLFLLVAPGKNGTKTKKDELDRQNTRLNQFLAMRGPNFREKKEEATTIQNLLQEAKSYDPPATEKPSVSIFNRTSSVHKKEQKHIPTVQRRGDR